jgi:hypothetical protein
MTNALNLQVSYPPPGPSDDHISTEYVAVKLMFGSTDLAAGGFTITSLLLVSVECLSSYFMSAIKLFVPCPQLVSRLHRISQIFVCLAWYILCPYVRHCLIFALS